MGGDFFGAVDDVESIRAIREAIDSGINFIDTAPAYGNGHAEKIVGQAVAGHRDEVVIASRVGILRTPEGGFLKNLKPDSVRREMDATLSRLGTDYVDVYIIHWPDPDTPLDDTLEEIQRIHDAGEFRYLGVSSFSTELMDECRRAMPIVCSQPHYSLLERACEKDVLPYCRQHGIGTMGYGSLAGGILTGKYRKIPEFSPGDQRAAFYDYYREPQWARTQGLVDTLREIGADHDATAAQTAINWARRDQDGVTTALVGAKTTQQARSNAAAGSWSLSTEEIGRIEQVWGSLFRDV